MTTYPSSPRLLPNGQGVICDQCGKQWDPAKGEQSDCVACAIAIKLVNVSSLFVEHDMFHTPRSNQEITDWVMRHTPEEQVHLLTLWGMVHNYYAYKLNQLAEEVQHGSDTKDTRSPTQANREES